MEALLADYVQVLGRSPDEVAPPPPGLSASELAALRERTATSSGDSCPVCLSPFRAKKTSVVELPCRHVFCAKCTTKWMESHTTCPLCRAVVKPEVVIEVCVTDVQTDKADGTPVRNRVLAYEDNQWETMRYLPGASLLHPSLVRIREDKEVNPVDLRVAQLTERCHIDSLEQEATKVALPGSEVIRREVYTKSGKGGMAVRKLVCWRTNKEEESEAFPAYVVHFTDYSPGRKTPLAREVRLAPDLETATGIAEGLIQANIKKGWEPA